MVNKYTDSNIEKMAEEMCDKYCKFPGEIKEDDLLQDICNKCPLNNLISKAYYKELGQMKNKRIKSNLEINNLPDYPLRKFTVFRLVDCDLWFYGTYDNEHIATTVAEQLNNAFVANTEGA